MTYQFRGKWITDGEFANLEKRNVFHRQLEPVNLPCEEHRNCHILFRKQFYCEKEIKNAKIYISADDYYKLYINGEFVAQGPASAYHFQYPYNGLDIEKYLKPGKNLIAVHTLYQGLINRVWQSGDNRHGMILDLWVNEELMLASDETFKTARHSAYHEIGTAGYDTQFLEEYDARSPEVGFEREMFDDSAWEEAKLSHCEDHILKEQSTSMLSFEKILPVELSCEKTAENYKKIIVDFGAVYVGYLQFKGKGDTGKKILIRCGQELSEDGSVRYEMRCNCKYEEAMILSGEECTLDWFDYKSFRYAELVLPKDCEAMDICLIARHYPFTLKTRLKPEYAEDPDLRMIWNLCVRTIQYGVQEVIQDCMDREKGFYVGDGCYTLLTHMLLTQDDSITRKLIDDAFSADFITDGLVTCLDCSMMQEIAEYPLMLISLVLWHYRLTGDKEYLAVNYPKVKKLLEAYRRDYEKGGLLRNLDKWCVVEWPKNFRHGYDVEIEEGKVCRSAHISINAYYLNAIKIANQMAELLEEPMYRDEEEVKKAFFQAFYLKERHVFRDGEETEHISLVGNLFPFAFGILPDEQCREVIIQMLEKEKISSVALFCSFLALQGLLLSGRKDLVKEALLDENAWKRMLREGATATFEGWGKDSKWNTSLFHLTLSYAAVFMADLEIENIL